METMMVLATLIGGPRDASTTEVPCLTTPDGMLVPPTTLIGLGFTGCYVLKSAFGYALEYEWKAAF